MRLPPRIKTRLDARLQTRLSDAIQEVSRYLRTNRGDNDGYETNVKLIPDPRTHFDVEQELLGAIGSSGALIAQSRSTFIASREFEIGVEDGDFRVIIGGTVTSTDVTVIPGLWRFKFDGANTEFYRNGELLHTIATIAGPYTSAAATTSISMSRTGLGGYENFYKGVTANVLIRNAPGVATNGYAIASNSNDVPDTIGSADAAVIEGLAGDWGLYTKQVGGEWLGINISDVPELLNVSWGWPDGSEVLAAVVEGHKYRISADVVVTGGDSRGFKIRTGGHELNPISRDGSWYWEITATTSNMQFVTHADGWAGDIRNISIQRELVEQ
jgi:hypothetical protein